MIHFTIITYKGECKFLNVFKFLACHFLKFGGNKSTFLIILKNFKVMFI